MLNLLLDSGLPEWVTASFPIIRIVFLAIILLCAIAVIVSVMRAESNPEGGANVISGTNDSFYAQNQASTKEGRIKKWITISSIVLVVVVILFFISYIIYPVGI